jgi:hypothetical protein
MSQFK